MLAAGYWWMDARTPGEIMLTVFVVCGAIAICCWSLALAQQAYRYRSLAEKYEKELKCGRIAQQYLCQQDPPLCVYEWDTPYARVKEVDPYHLTQLREDLGLPPLPNKKEEPPQLAATPPVTPKGDQS